MAKSHITLDNGVIGSVEINSLTSILGEDLRGLLHLGWIVTMCRERNSCILCLQTMILQDDKAGFRDNLSGS